MRKNTAPGVHVPTAPSDPDFGLGPLARRGSLKTGRLTGTVRLRGVKPFLGGVSFREAWQAKTLGRSRLERRGRPKTGHFGRKTAQIFQGTILDNFGAKVTQMLQMVSLGTISDHLGPKASQML